MSPETCEVIQLAMEGCPHRHVVPVLPAHITSAWSTIEGVCLDCGDGPYVMWEAYGYGDAHAEAPYPSRTEVLADFEAWWAHLSVG